MAARLASTYDATTIDNIQAQFGVRILSFIPGGRQRAIMDDAVAALPGLVTYLDVLEGAAAPGGYRWARGGGVFADVDVVAFPCAGACDVSQRGNHIFVTEGAVPAGRGHFQELGRVLEIRWRCRRPCPCPCPVCSDALMP